MQFLDTLASNEQSNALKASLIIYVLSGNIMVPRELQLQAALAEIAGFDTSVMSGTGTGKTLIMAIPHILYPRRVSFVISLLKRLQVSQGVLQNWFVAFARANEALVIRSAHFSSGESEQLP